MEGRLKIFVNACRKIINLCSSWRKHAKILLRRLPLLESPYEVYYLTLRAYHLCWQNLT